VSSEIRQKIGTSTDLTITLASIADGAGRICTQVDNSNLWVPAVYIHSEIKSGAVAPTAGAIYKFYLVRDDGQGYRSDGLGSADAAVSTEPENARIVGSIVVTATANKVFYGDFVIQDPGYKWSLVFWNSSGEAINSTEADSYIRYSTAVPERR